VGVQGSGEDLFCGIIFYEGKVKMLSFIKNDFGGEHVESAANSKDGAYIFNRPHTIKWQAGPYRHEMDKRLLKHTVDGGKKGFFRGLCFVEAPREIQLLHWGKQTFQQGEPLSIHWTAPWVAVIRLLDESRFYFPIRISRPKLSGRGDFEWTLCTA
jgi:hypothetical protein